jgi:NADPH:quinone reductase-like Zn-dependent oxidoreductase
VRAETWLAIAGGAGAVGYFPNHWAGPIGAEIARTNRELKELTPALLAAEATAHSDTDAVKVSARTLNGALYVIAVNTTEATVQAKIAVDGIAGRSVIPVGGGAAIGADDQGFSDTFGPLAARVYVIPPQGW